MIKTGLIRQGRPVYIREDESGFYSLYGDSSGWDGETWYLCFDRSWRRNKAIVSYHADVESAYDFALTCGTTVVGPAPVSSPDISKDYEELDQSPQEI